jgi:glutamine amidotransferase
MIKLIDIGISNIGSMENMLKKIGVPYDKVSDNQALGNASKIIFPGVGSYGAAVKRLDETKIREYLDKAHQEGIPILGVCLGMQLFGCSSQESPSAKGLGFIPAEVKKINVLGGRLPHMGWNNINHNESGLFNNLAKEIDFYFVHTYSYRTEDLVNIESYEVDYGESTVAYFKANNLIGAQFHPEKSQRAGLTFIENFLKYA